jgi:uncharacterized membrane protein (DUF2068 family)
MGGKRQGRGWLTLIGIFKAAKSVALVAVGVMALAIVHDESTKRTFAHWEFVVSFAPGHRMLHEAIAKVAGLEPHKLEEIGIGSFVYAAVFAVEGVGLLLQKRWAEYVTSGVTLSFIPLEIYEIVKKPTAVRVVALAVNVLVVVYLGWRIRHDAQERGADKERATAPAPAPAAR